MDYALAAGYLFAACERLHVVAPVGQIVDCGHAVGA